ncbi:hypothetical protein [Thiothrix unzii]|uniref:SH3 domain-containing protein n=1 Tax=Thiothrix unzii TaxID=111769 RepID=A0A975F8J4_9GAMM|nr:hypothetical protein [Thiothrix unzii]QTR53395.1 hypothetical protein J9260_17095 [Thiothrix unzii]
MYYCRWLVLVALLGGCKDSTAPATPVEIPEQRVVATVYVVNASSGSANCYRTPDSNAPSVATLRNGQLVDLVAEQEGIIQRGTQFWLHVYPRLSHRPSCYLNVDSLVPVS